VDVPRPLIIKCLENSTFVHHSSLALCAFTVSPSILGRLASLAIAAFQAAPSLAIESCCFIESLLSHIDNPSVFAFFERICSGQSNSPVILKWMRTYDFAKEVVRQIEEINFARQIPESELYIDNDIWRLMGFYSLIHVCRSNSSFRSSFQTVAALSACGKRFPSEPPSLSGARWRALGALCGPNTVHHMVPLAELALATLFRPSAGPTQETVESISFLTTAAPLSGAIVSLLAKSQIFQVLLGMVIMYNTSSHLLAAFRSFTLEAVRVSELSEKLIRVFLPFLMSEAVDKGNGYLSSSCWILLTYLHSRSVSDGRLRGFLAQNADWQIFVKSDLVPFALEMRAQYGGPLPVDHD
jgi:hypothetical protein